MFIIQLISMIELATLTINQASIKTAALITK